MQEHSDASFALADIKRLFKAVDAHCAKLLPNEERGGWFSPVILGGVSTNHIPPHILYAVYAIYAHLARGDADPVPFLAGPLNENGVTAITLEPTSRFMVVDRDRQAYPMTDLLIAIPSSTPVGWTLDNFGLPPLREAVQVVGWHSAAQPHPTAVSGGQLLLHLPSRRLLSPVSAFTAEEEEIFFAEPVLSSKLERHRDRMVETLGTPIDVIARNMASARAVVEAYLSPSPR